MKELTTVTLSSNQKRVMAKIVASPTPKVAGEEISGSQNLVAARDQLSKLGAIQSVDGEASLTDVGQRLAREENIIDDSGGLTPDGEQLAHSSVDGKADQTIPPQPSASPTPGMSGPSSPGSSLGTPGAMPPDASQELNMSDAPRYERLQLLQEFLSYVKK